MKEGEIELTALRGSTFCPEDIYLSGFLFS
jgi:hypothetical protein